MRHYVILTVTTGRCVYSGTSESLAADALIPGTVWGRGYSVPEAEHEARLVADRIFKSGYTGPEREQAA